MLALHVPVMTRRGNGDLKHCVNSVNWGVYCQLPAVFQKARVFFFLNMNHLLPRWTRKLATWNAHFANSYGISIWDRELIDLINHSIQCAIIICVHQSGMP